MSEVVIVVVSAVVGALAGVVTTAWKSRKDLEAQYDIDLRKRRIEAYAELWRTLEPLAYHFPPRPITPEVVAELGPALRCWYFRTGGLVLSASTRPAYFNLQTALEGASAAPASPEAAPDPHFEPSVAVLKALASRLRTSSTRDVATRVGPRLGPSLAARLARGRRRHAAPVRITADRRWLWVKGRPEPAFYVVVENGADREIEITGVHVEGVGDAVSDESERMFRLQPGEDREVHVQPKAPETAPLAPLVTVTVDGRLRVTSRAKPAVPLQSHLYTRLPGGGGNIAA